MFLLAKSANYRTTLQLLELFPTSKASTIVTSPGHANFTGGALFHVTRCCMLLIILGSDYTGRGTLAVK
jgi:hypothetical protein